MGIEPTSKAWEAAVLPLNYTRDPQILQAAAGEFFQILRLRGTTCSRTSARAGTFPTVIA